MAAKGRTTYRANAGESEGGKEALFKRDISPSFLPPPPLSLSPQWRLRQSLSFSFSAGPPRPVPLPPLLFSRLRQSREGSPFGGGGPTTDCRGQRREGTSQSFIGASAVEKGENRQEVERAPSVT